jgi:hypothetical protein
MHYVMILVFLTTNGPVTTSVDFRTLDNCTAAENSIIQSLGGSAGSVYGGCYLK